MSQLRDGVIGCVSIAKFRHLLEYGANKNVDIVAVCDVVESRAKEMAENYGAAAYTDYIDFIADKTIYVISICLPNYLHAPVSIAASEAGKHVLRSEEHTSELQSRFDLVCR